MHFIPAEIEDYAGRFTTPGRPLLNQLNRETHAKVLYPQMLSGHMQGRVLSFISKILKPELIVEVGTYTGYSAICLAEGLKPGGRIITIEKNEELRPFCGYYFGKAKISGSIEAVTGDAKKILPGLKGKIDLAFIDADKENYLSYYKILMPKIRKGGVIIADNVLWNGKVLDTSVNDKETKGIRAFNEFVRKDKRVENVLLPVRDGLMLIRKK